MASHDDIVNNHEADPQWNLSKRGRFLFENRNYKDALSIYLRIAETQWGRTIYVRIGWMYEFGMGTNKDPQQAKQWYERAADAGIPEGYYSLASMRFREGKDDQVRALMEHAAAKGYSPALFHLGQMYRFGKGVPVDTVKAYEYYRQAAALGHLFAQRAVAQTLMRGERGLCGIPKGLFMVARIMWSGFRLQLKNPSDDRIRRLA